MLKKTLIKKDPSTLDGIVSIFMNAISILPVIF